MKQSIRDRVSRLAGYHPILHDLFFLCFRCYSAKILLSVPSLIPRSHIKMYNYIIMHDEGDKGSFIQYLTNSF